MSHSYSAELFPVLKENVEWKWSTSFPATVLRGMGFVWIVIVICDTTQV
jgi:hypothetical protein